MDSVFVKVERRREPADASTDDHHIMSIHAFSLLDILAWTRRRSNRLSDRTRKPVADHLTKLCFRDFSALGGGKLGKHLDMLRPFEFGQSLPL